MTREPDVHELLHRFLDGLTPSQRTAFLRINQLRAERLQALVKTMGETSSRVYSEFDLVNTIVLLLQRPRRSKKAVGGGQ